MKIGLVGWGIETKSAFDYFGPTHNYLICNEEKRDDFPADCNNVSIQYLDMVRTSGMPGTIKDFSYLRDIENCELVVFSVAARKNLESLFNETHHFWKIAKTTQHIFFENCPTKNIIGVTGTKGKGTTSTLIYKMLLASHYNAYLAGNIGISVLDLLPKLKADDWVVLELSSFQLYKLPHSPHIGVHLMMMPEHLDWHDSMEEYADAKSNLFAHQSTNDIAIYLPTNTYSLKNAEKSNGTKIPYTEEPGAYVNESGYFTIDDQDICLTRDAKLLGNHNYENICAAVTAAWLVTRDINAIRSVITSFSGLEHRLEYIAEINGISFYDDSFGTTPDTAIVAMNAFTEPKIMIVGGS